MGSRAGYEYRYRFSMLGEHETLESSYTSRPMREGRKSFIVKIRTDFIIVRRISTEEEEGAAAAARVYIGSERYDARVLADEEAESVLFFRCFRLWEYWMSPEEIKLFADQATDFARRMAADPQHASSNLFPIVASLEVCTVQQEGESFDAAMDRAITEKKLVPLYLWSVFPRPKHKPDPPFHSRFLRSLRRIRVEDADGMSAMLACCCICKRGPYIGAQITLLRCCNDAFHSHCIVRWLEDNNLCPACNSRVYHSPCV